MAENKPRQKPRAHKESKGKNGSGGKGRKLTPLEGVLINRSGPVGHRLRSVPQVGSNPKKRPRD